MAENAEEALLLAAMNGSLQGVEAALKAGKYSFAQTSKNYEKNRLLVMIKQFPRIRLACSRVHDANE